MKWAFSGFDLFWPSSESRGRRHPISFALLLLKIST